MKRRAISLMLLTINFVLIISFVSFAGQWKQEEGKWRWQEDDGSFTTYQWKEINGKWYYFDPWGYMLSNAVTRDGYTVGEDGAWIPGGLNNFPVSPYASILNAFWTTYANEPSYIIKSFVDFNLNDLVDHGDFYEIRNQTIKSWFGDPSYWDNEGVLYTGSVFVYKNAKIEEVSSTPSMTFEQALYDTNVRNDAFSLNNGLYHWALYLPDEKGYFSEFIPAQAD